MDGAPGEKVINIDGEWLHGHAGTAEPLHRIFGGFQPFGIALVELVGIREQRLDAWPVSFPIPSNAEHHTGFGLYRFSAFSLGSPDIAFRVVE
jgi:hypothetical protein